VTGRAGAPGPSSTGPGTTGTAATGTGAMGPGARDALDAHEVEALVTDRYLEGLLAATERRAADAPCDAALDPDLRRTALRLRDELVRVHPSFRFEERLARRLAEAAATMRPAAAAGGGTVPVPFVRRLLPDPTAFADPAPSTHPALLPDPAASVARAAGVPRPLLVGGAVTSAALSVAGAAVVAWLLSRGHDASVARAVRVARAARAGRAVLRRGLA